MKGKMAEQRIIQISMLKPAEYNPRVTLKPGDAEYEKIKRSIQKFGFADPVVVNSDMTIIGGHQRVNVATDLGYTEVPCAVVDLNKNDEKALNVALNKITGRTDAAKLAQLLQGLSIGGYDATVTGYTQKECDALISGLTLSSEATDDGYDLDEKVKSVKTPYVRRGQIYELGKHRVMCGDSTSESDVDELLGGLLADCLITDPPYNIAYVGKTKDKLTIQNDKMNEDEYYKFLLAFYKNANRVMKAGASYYVWHADSESLTFRLALRDAGFQLRQTLIWNKNCMTLGRQDYQWKHEPCLYGWKDGESHRWFSDRCQTTVMDYNKPLRSEEHPTMKPIELFAYQIGNSTLVGDAVLDLFGGSGTTVIACEQMKRSAYVMELDPKYCQVIIDRWEEYTGQKAVLARE